MQRGPNAPVRYRVRWRTASGAERSRTFMRHDEAARYRAQIEGDLISASWIDLMLARVPLADWAAQWRSTIVDLRPTSLGRLDSTLANHVLPQWGDTPLSAITNADVRAWVARMRASGMSASSVRKAAFTLRQILAAFTVFLRVKGAGPRPSPADWRIMLDMRLRPLREVA